MFIKIKVFVKKNFPGLYHYIHKFFNSTYENFYRSKKLKSFISETCKDISFAGQKYRIWLDPKNAFIDEEIYVNGVYEPEILILHKEFLREGSTYVDIGANIGDTALFAASIVGPSGAVVCFEPIVHLAQQIERSIESNNFSNITVINKAITLNNGEATIYKNNNNIGSSSILDLNINGEKETIQTTTGKELESLRKIDVMKIDVEGYEWVVIQALKDRIEKDKPVLIFEYTPDLYGKDREKIMLYLASIGYKLFDIEENQKEIINLKTWLESFSKCQTNILCLNTQM